MDDIKTRNKSSGTIKTLDKVTAGSSRIRSIAIKIKGESEEASNDASEGSPVFYATEKSGKGIKNASRNLATKGDEYGRRGAKTTADKAKRIAEERRTGNSRTMKSASAGSQAAKKAAKNEAIKSEAIKKASNKAVTSTTGTAKTAESAGRIKKALSSAFNSLKLIVAGTRTLTLAAIGGGWIAVMAIVICIFVGGVVNIVDEVSVHPDQEGLSERDQRYIAEILAEYPNGYHGEASGDLVKVALSQVGNVGGRRYWSWYGFESRVDWCAIFVSWCADQCGYIEAGKLPKFSGVGDGVSWFQAKNQWKDRSYIPKAGDIIFFDWKPYGNIDHVGIVTACDGKRVYTVEGNSNDRCKELNYAVGSRCIYGYGIMK